MRPSFLPRLINDPLSDPGMFVPFLFEKRALLFDLGDIHSLPPKELLKISHVFVSHTHMDHFVGFDTLLRIFLGREKELHIFGPKGFFRHIEGKLSGYTWNLVSEYENNFSLKVTELNKTSILTRTYNSKNDFQPEKGVKEAPFSGALLKEPAFQVEAAILDHRIPCLGFSLTENFYVNIIKEELKRLGLGIGPWINQFKNALYENRDPESIFAITHADGDAEGKERIFTLGELTGQIARISPGQKVTYITDVVGSPQNREKIIALAKNSDHLFIEAAFMDCDRKTAKKKYHLTAGQAGRLAKEAGVKQLTVFHFSPRYSHGPEEISKEAIKAFITP